MPGSGKGLVGDYEEQLDAHFQAMVTNPDFPVPGVVVQLRRGSDTYAKSFGLADKESGRTMDQDAMIRMWSMTKVLCCATALRLYERGLFKLEDPVSDYIESFQRDWEIVKPSESGSKSVDYYAFVKGETVPLKYDTTPATKPMLIKHLMSETSGIEYDQFSDYDEFNGGALGCGWGGGVASALRRQQNPDVYRSTNILGADCTLAEFCDHIAAAGVLVCEPGEFSYGLGNTVLGRVVEVVYERAEGRFLRFSEITKELLFTPLGMTDATFWLPDGDPRAARIPTLYGARLEADGSTPVLPEPECLPASGPPILNGVAHSTGPRKYDAGDTGSLMPAADYAKFYEMLLAGGVSASGERILSHTTVQLLCKGRFRGLNLTPCDTDPATGAPEPHSQHGGLAAAMGVAGESSPFPRSFNFGWATSHGYSDGIAEFAPHMHPDMSNWGGCECSSSTPVRSSY